MDAIPQLDEDLVAKSLAELADADYQAQVWAGRVPTVSSSFLACYAALFGESGLAEALDDASESDPVFTIEIDDDLRRLRELLEAVDDRQPIRAVLSDRALGEARPLAADILRQLGVRNVTKRGLPELDLPLVLPPWPVWARVALAALLAIALLVAVLIVFRPSPRCDTPVSTDTVSVNACH
jgi:hypothetical protein